MKLLCIPCLLQSDHAWDTGRLTLLAQFLSFLPNSAHEKTEVLNNDVRVYYELLYGSLSITSPNLVHFGIVNYIFNRLDHRIFYKLFVHSI